MNWVYQDSVTLLYQIDTSYTCGPVPTPGFGPFIVTVPPARGPIITVLDRPTIAAKLVTRIPVGGFTLFEIWMCWEDGSVAASIPDIWYIVGQHNNAGPPFFFTFGPALVPYVPILSSDFNPELWNRNDAIRAFPPFTHLVFDQGIPVGGVPEIVYIDP